MVFIYPTIITQGVHVSMCSTYTASFNILFQNLCWMIGGSFCPILGVEVLRRVCMGSSDGSGWLRDGGGGCQLIVKGPEKMMIKFTLYGENQVVPSGALVFFCAKPCIKFWLVSSLFICEMSDSDSANGNNTKMTCVRLKSVSIKDILCYGSVERQ